MKDERDIEKLIDQIRIPTDAEVEAAGQRFDRRLRRIRLHRRLMWTGSSAAAVLLCGFIVAALWPKNGGEEVVELAKVSNIMPMPSTIKAPTLILSDGQSLNLEGEKPDTLIPLSNIRISDNHIAYDTTSAVQEIVYNTLLIPAGYTYNLTLADGTEVILNAGSRLKYPMEFVGDSREVALSGEAYFKVTPSDKPFEVNIDGSKVRVYGTQFNVKSVPGKMIETVLVEGKIGFTSPGHEEIEVEPGEQVAYNAESGDVDVQQVDVQYATAWLSGVFKYRDKPLSVILKDMALWYGVEFDSRIDLTKVELTMSLNKQTPIEEVVSFMELMTNYKFIKTERESYIIEARE